MGNSILAFFRFLCLLCGVCVLVHLNKSLKTHQVCFSTFILAKTMLQSFIGLFWLKSLQFIEPRIGHQQLSTWQPALCSTLSSCFFRCLDEGLGRIFRRFDKAPLESRTWEWSFQFFLHINAFWLFSTNIWVWHPWAEPSEVQYQFPKTPVFTDSEAISVIGGN